MQNSDKSMLIGQWPALQWVQSYVITIPMLYVGPNGDKYSYVTVIIKLKLAEYTVYT